jgi:hypothetical protein
MTGEELFALFITDDTAPEQVAYTDFGDLVRHIAGIRHEKPDDIGLSDMEITMRIQDYVQYEQTRISGILDSEGLSNCVVL